jgi:hypothetical protein
VAFGHEREHVALALGEVCERRVVAVLEESRDDRGIEDGFALGRPDSTPACSSARARS